MKSISMSFFCVFVFFFTALNSSTAQKQVKETALVYDLSLIKPNVPQGKVNNKDAELKIWIKPDQSRSETI